jgi:hypothetical protein
VTAGAPASYHGGMKPGVIALLAAMAVAAAGCGGSGSPLAPAPPAPLHGPRVAGQVLVAAVGTGDVRICGSQTSDLMFGPPACVGGPRAVGIDPDALHNHSSKPAERWDYLYVVGRYRPGNFYVTSYSRHGPPNQPAGSSFDRVPCVAPPGGWRVSIPTQSQRGAVDHYSKLAHHHDLVDIAYFDHGSILTVASSNPARTRWVLGRYWPRQLCVVKAGYPRSLVIREGKKMIALIKQPNSAGAATFGWPTGGGGTAVSGLGQPMTNLDVLLVTPQLRAYLQKQPPGLVQVQASLNPLGRT